MSLPDLENTWQFDVNNANTAGATFATSAAKLLYSIKAALVGFTSNPWTVVSSSNASSYGASDLWLSENNITFTNTAANHSWIVLKQTGMASNYQICLDCYFNNTPVGIFVTIMVSPSAGFTGGGLAARPTATDEFPIDGTIGTTTPSSPYLFGQPTSGAFASVSHVMMTEAGDATRIVCCYNAVSTCYIFFEKIRSPITGVTTPFIHGQQSNVSFPGTNQPSLTLWYSGQSAIFQQSATHRRVYLTGEAYNGSLVSSVSAVSDINSAWLFSPVGLYCNTAGVKGRLGYISDIWWGASSGVGSGDTYPDDTTRQFVQFGNMVFPWNGTTPVMT